MNTSKILKDILSVKGITIAEFAGMVDRAPQTIYNMIYRNSISCRTLESWLDTLDCDIVVIDRKTGEIYE